MEITQLTSVKKDTVCTVVGIDRCCKARKRLCELGLHKNAKLKVIKNDFGPLILNLSGNKLALGRTLASHIMVEI